MSLIQLQIFVLIVAFTEGDKCPSGGQIYARGTSEAGMKEIVNVHNYYRTLIANGKVQNQPRGVNLKKMKYDNVLALKAQIISNTCQLKHLKVEDDRWSVGQNLGKSFSNKLEKNPTQEWNTTIMNWFNENEHFIYYNITSLTASHYTQVIWANSNFIGCDFIYYYDVDKPKFPYTKLYTCNYGPSGNVLNQVPYKTGMSGCENLC